MKRDPFVAARKERWERLSRLVAELDRPLRRRSRRGVEELAPLYRRVCQDLAIARRRGYGRDLVERLNTLALSARNHVYRDRARWMRTAASFIARDFPRRVREEWRFFWLAALVYLLPLAATMLVARDRPDLLFAAIDPEMVQMFEDMYAPDGPMESGRSADEALAMFGFYVQNNGSGDLRAFAGGALWGVGTLLFLFYNALVHGAVFGHVTNIGYGDMLWPFVVNHATVELTALFIASAAGLRLGAAMIAPGRRTRARALREDGARSLSLLAGAMAMTVAAAFVEGFWSASAAPESAKYAVGAALFVATFAYFLLAGRGR